jgi:hypothetical protein
MSPETQSARNWQEANPDQKNFPAFWDFEETGKKVFIGKILEVYEHNPENLPEAEWTAILTEDEEGTKHYLPNHSAIRKAYELNGGDVVYRIEFLKKVQMKNKKNFMQYDIKFDKENFI